MYLDSLSIRQGCKRHMRTRLCASAQAPEDVVRVRLSEIREGGMEIRRERGREVKREVRNKGSRIYSQRDQLIPQLYSSAGSRPYLYLRVFVRAGALPEYV